MDTDTIVKKFYQYIEDSTIKEAEIEPIIEDEKVVGWRFRILSEWREDENTV